MSDLMESISIPLVLEEVLTIYFLQEMTGIRKKNPKQVWKVRTLRQIMESLGHQDKYFDILKMDIEYHEWEALESILKDNLTARIRQLDIEFHIFPDTPNTKIANFLKIYQTFKEAGFRRYASKMSYYNSNEKRIQTDCEYMNLKFDFNKYPVP
ncbi:unnamed protein product [Mytilus coruscus]|uniref:Methyltransferase domain-containing protein n=1 Tax=Mytilus coruscus TaxID=42192 RepID=A0A6J8C4J3_MYTCO|nr:unnamed protein product [Mytilus coruscus]